MFMALTFGIQTEFGILTGICVCNNHAPFSSLHIARQMACLLRLSQESRRPVSSSLASSSVS